MALFESYERRIDKINAVLAQYGIKSIEEAKAIVEGADIRKDEVLEKHADWVDEFMPKYSDVNKDNVMDILQNEVGIVFGKVLEHAGVYKRDEAGAHAFDRFISTLG